MSMFKSTLELEKMKMHYESLIDEARFDAECTVRKKDLDIEEAVNEVKKEMQKSLIESDLKRVEAIAKLEIYEKQDNKDQINKITDMLEEAIKSLGSKDTIVNVKK